MATRGTRQNWHPKTGVGLLLVLSILLATGIAPLAKTASASPSFCEAIGQYFTEANAEGEVALDLTFPTIETPGALSQFYRYPVTTDGAGVFNDGPAQHGLSIPLEVWERIPKEAYLSGQDFHPLFVTVADDAASTTLIETIGGAMRCQGFAVLTRGEDGSWIILPELDHPIMLESGGCGADRAFLASIQGSTALVVQTHGPASVSYDVVDISEARQAEENTTIDCGIRLQGHVRHIPYFRGISGYGPILRELDELGPCDAARQVCDFISHNTEAIAASMREEEGSVSSDTELLQDFQWPGEEPDLIGNTSGYHLILYPGDRRRPQLRSVLVDGKTYILRYGHAYFRSEKDSTISIEVWEPSNGHFSPVLESFLVPTVHGPMDIVATD